MAAATLRITIESASGLVNKDSGFAGKSDPYCVVTVREKKDQVITTPVINNCLDPVWNFTGDIAGCVDTDHLEFEVWDKDTFPKPDQSLGKVTLTPQDFFPYGIAGQLPLAGAGSETAAISVHVQVIPDGVDTNAATQQLDAPTQPLEAQGQQKTLEITIVAASGLQNMDGFMAGKSDPYVICEVPGQPNMNFQTPVVNNSLNPEWNHTEFVHNFFLGDALEFQLWDKDTFPKPDQLMGKVTIGPEEFHSHPCGFDADLPLEGSGAQGTLSVKVLVHESEVQPADPAEQVGEPHLAQADSEPAAPTSKVKLSVEVLNGIELPHKEGFGQGKADLYCICQVPGSGGLLHKARKFETPVVKDNTSPEWNHVGEILGFAMGEEALEFEVWDKNSFPMPDKSVGKVTLSPEDFNANPQGLEGELPLNNDKGEPAGTLAIRVHVLLDATATAPDEMPSAQPVPEGERGEHLQPGVHNIAEGQAGSIPIGASYRGGILVSERWGPPVAMSSMVTGAAIRVPMPSAQVPTPMPASTPLPSPASPNAPAVVSPSMPSMPATSFVLAASPAPSPQPASTMFPMPTMSSMPAASPALASATLPAAVPATITPSFTSLPTSTKLATSVPAAVPVPTQAQTWQQSSIFAQSSQRLPISTLSAPSSALPLSVPMPATGPATAVSAASRSPTLAPRIAATSGFTSTAISMVASVPSGAVATTTAVPFPAAAPTTTMATSPLLASRGPAMPVTMNSPPYSIPSSTPIVSGYGGAAMMTTGTTYGAPMQGDITKITAINTAPAFDQLDKDHDGVLSREEFEAAQC
mmetsp:Transcript_23090/g.64555  ORF Transcript_23090/g.64555 Transcript_23090/m.64555 type:complete len:809 (-) Transcript_23090:311-2737(-)